RRLRLGGPALPLADRPAALPGAVARVRAPAGDEGRVRPGPPGQPPGAALAGEDLSQGAGGRSRAALPHGGRAGTSPAAVPRPPRAGGGGGAAWAAPLWGGGGGPPPGRRPGPADRGGGATPPLAATPPVAVPSIPLAAPAPLKIETFEVEHFRGQGQDERAFG